MMKFGLIPILNHMLHRLSWGTTSSSSGIHTSLSSSSPRSSSYSSEEDPPFPCQINQNNTLGSFISASTQESHGQQYCASAQQCHF
eukprot:5746364-Ditylum_brightwellii.AAC.1